MPTLNSKHRRYFSIAKVFPQLIWGQGDGKVLQDSWGGGTRASKNTRAHLSISTPCDARYQFVPSYPEHCRSRNYRPSTERKWTRTVRRRVRSAISEYLCQLRKSASSFQSSILPVWNIWDKFWVKSTRSNWFLNRWRRPHGKSLWLRNSIS